MRQGLAWGSFNVNQSVRFIADKKRSRLTLPTVVTSPAGSNLDKYSGCTDGSSHSGAPPGNARPTIVTIFPLKSW